MVTNGRTVTSPKINKSYKSNYVINNKQPGQLSWYSDGLQAGQLGAPLLAGARDFVPFHSIQTGYEAHPASYPIGSGGAFPRAKVAGHNAVHSSPSSDDVKNGGDIPPLPPHVSMA